MCKAAAMLRALCICLLTSAAGLNLVHAERAIRIGILSFEGTAETKARWQPTADYLQSTIRHLKFEILPLGYDELNAAVKAGDLDFVFTNPEHYVVLRNVYRISPMVTLSTLNGNQGSNQFGGTIFSLSEGSVKELKDVKGKKVAAVGLYSLGGFLAAADVLRHEGIKLQSSDVASLEFTGTPHSKVVQEVLGGKADVGMVRTGVLEQLASQGKLDLSKIHVLNLQPLSVYPQALSTDLFPEWPFAAMPNTSQALVKEVALALLNISQDSTYAIAGKYYGFSPPANYAPVEELMRRLKVYPNINSEPLWKELWLTYSEELRLAGFAFFLIVLGNSVYLWIGNRRLRRLTNLYREAQHGFEVTSAAFESQVGIIVTDERTNIVRANSAFTNLFGYEESQLLGYSTSILRSYVIPPGTLKQIWPTLLGKGRWQGELTCRHKSGHQIPCIVAITVLHKKLDSVSGFVGSFLDISEQKKAESEARKLAMFDPLTELPNRRLFIEKLHAEITSDQRGGALGALMFLDLDDFKALNDTYGHTIGDQLLQQIAKRLRVIAGPHALVARLGGDEFVLMWSRLESEVSMALQQASAFAWQVRRAILDPFELSTRKVGGEAEAFLNYRISCSIGVTLFGEREEPVVDALKRADLAMYQSKKAGKDTIRFFDANVQNALTERVALNTDLNEALSKGQLLLHYQLQITDDGRAVGAECLLRWMHPNRGFVSPLEFVGLAEESGAIIAIGDWVTRQACETLAQWAKSPHLEILTLSVNVSPRQFIDPDFVLIIERALQESGANPKRLCLEITEGIVLQDADQVIEKMQRLCSMGLSFSIDDFGTGYSSLSYLQRLPLRELKIDKAFVNDLATNTTSEAIVRAIVALGSSMGIAVLAEGVETNAQRARLAELGCELMQGYLFAKPMELSFVEERLKELAFGTTASRNTSSIKLVQ
jgi:diguanylate cyclase (GGDEF)-like protein/PAS domain S-box-containing protein